MWPVEPIEIVAHDTTTRTNHYERNQLDWAAMNEVPEDTRHVASTSILLYVSAVFCGYIPDTYIPEKNSAACVV